MTLHVVVIGAGIVGATTALELLNDGHRVTLVEPGAPGGEQAASYGNAAWLSPASIIPMSMPGLWRKVPGYLLDPQSPLTIRWRMLPRLMPWLLRFLLAGTTVAKVERTARVLTGLLRDAPARHAALAAGVGQPDLVQRRGLLYAYPDRAAFEAEALDYVGAFAIEFFEVDGQLLANEMAPRVHNSGHHTIEANYSSQFDMLWRIMLGYPLGCTDHILPAAIVNLIGAEGYSGPAQYQGLNDILAIENAFVHIYGKTHTKPGRKMGHVTRIEE